MSFSNKLDDALHTRVWNDIYAEIVKRNPDPQRTLRWCIIAGFNLLVAAWVGLSFYPDAVKYHAEGLACERRPGCGMGIEWSFWSDFHYFVVWLFLCGVSFMASTWLARAVIGHKRDKIYRHAICLSPEEGVALGRKMVSVHGQYVDIASRYDSSGVQDTLAAYLFFNRGTKYD